jgi:RNA polymerase sigma-70 factor (ECF subfamily)
LETFDYIYQTNYAAIFRLVSRFVGDEAAAADIVQEVFIKFYRQMQANINIEFPKTYLSKMATNECLNFLTRKRKHLSLEDAKNLECNENVENQIIKIETQTLVQQAINHLKTKEQILLGLYSENFSYKEISEISGVKFSTVGKAVARALEKLKHILEHKKYEMSY